MPRGLNLDQAGFVARLATGARAADQESGSPQRPRLRFNSSIAQGPVVVSNK